MSGDGWKDVLRFAFICSRAQGANSLSHKLLKTGSGQILSDGCLKLRHFIFLVFRKVFRKEVVKECRR